jgi:hypothetical protein
MAFSVCVEMLNLRLRPSQMDPVHLRTPYAADVSQEDEAASVAMDEVTGSAIHVMLELSSGCSDR